MCKKKNIHLKSDKLVNIKAQWWSPNIKNYIFWRLKSQKWAVHYSVASDLNLPEKFLIYYVIEKQHFFSEYSETIASNFEDNLEETFSGCW